MHIRSHRTSLCRPIVHLAMSVLCIAMVAGCASIQGYPDDPENSAFALRRLAAYFDGTREQDYLNARADPRTAPATVTKLRNEIVYARMRAYDVAFAEFERELYGGANSVALGSDFAALVLAGLTATTGNAATKSALGAASIGILGAKTAISKDLFYERTIPALLAQMEANRLKIRVVIVKALKLDDAEYSLMQAYGDLDAYKSAGSIPGAINAINLDAGEAKAAAVEAIVFERASAVAQLQGITTVRAEFDKLTTDAQVLALAKAMQPFLAFRSPDVQKLVKTLDPNDLRLSAKPNAAKKARQVINAWINTDDVSPVNQQQWRGAIATASTAK
jgi:hypothetical protein